MTDFNSAYQSFGKFSVPLSIGDITDTLSVLDPVRDRLLALFVSAINDEFGAPWEKVTPFLADGNPLIGTSPVEDSYPEEPTLTLMTERKAGFPLLCLHRTGDPLFEQYLLDRDKLTQQWHMHWILGPADIDTRRRLGDVGRSIGLLVKMIERDFGHKSFEDGANQFESATGGLMSLRLLNHSQLGSASFADDEQNRVFWACRYTVETTELVSDLVDHEADFEGMDISLDVSGANNPNTNFDFVQASTDGIQETVTGSDGPGIFDETFDETFG